jgi:hypothetical protein
LAERKRLPRHVVLGLLGSYGLGVLSYKMQTKAILTTIHPKIIMPHSFKAGMAEARATPHYRASDFNPFRESPGKGLYWLQSFPNKTTFLALLKGLPIKN